MSEWREARLGEVCSRLRSGTNITAKDIHEVGEVPVFGGNGIRGYTSEPNFSGECAIIGRQGAYCGNVRYFNGSARMSEHAVVAVADAGNNTRFLAYLLSTMNLGRLSGQAAQPGLSVKILAQEPVLMPPLDLQTRVASFVGSIDDLIENNRRRVEVLEEMARAIYREWFVKFRYLGLSDVPMIDSPLGPIPEGWAWGRVNDVVKVVKDTVDPSTIDPEIPAVGLEHIPRNQVTLDSWGVAGEQGSRKAVFAKGDVLFGKIRPYFHKVSVAPFDGISSTDAIIIRPEERHWGEIVLLLSSADFVAHATQTSNGTKMPRANWKVLGQWPVAIPPSDLANHFTSIVKDQLGLAERLMFENRQLSDLRDTLLPKLVTGQIDVSTLDLDALVKEAAA